MQYKKLVIGALVLLMVGGATGASASAPGATRLLQGVPDWQQVNSSGFGNPLAVEVSAVEAFNGYLYAGIDKIIDGTQTIDGAQIFRSADGVQWTAVTQPGFGIAHDIAPPAIMDFVVFNNRLYASTGRGANPGQIYRTTNGLIWAPMVIHGFSNPDNVDISAFAIYDGMIYAGVKNRVSGAQIWASATGDNNTWTQVAPAAPGTEAAAITGFAVHDGALWAAVESAGPVQIWRSYGGDWETVVSDGFGSSLTTLAGGVAEFSGRLYVGAGNTAEGAQLWRTLDGTTWEQAIPSGFGDPNNKKVESVFVFQNQLYVSVRNMQTGLELWRSGNGTQWQQANLDGFGDSNNASSNWSNAAASFQGRLYVGTANATAGGELWRMLSPYIVSLSPDDTLAGAAGQNVMYSLTITNSGDMADTYGLTTASNVWTSVLSTPTIALAPGASSDFSVSVSIPAGALATETDVVTVTATSQGDPATGDSTLLTTTVMPSHGVALSPDQAKQGYAGQTISYALGITNIGNAPDSFSLAASGQTWTTTLSASHVALAPATTTTFTVTVAILPAALAAESDTATITATSQGDGSKHDIAVLTTASTGPPARVYLPFVSGP